MLTLFHVDSDPEFLTCKLILSDPGSSRMSKVLQWGNAPWLSYFVEDSLGSL